MGNWLRDITEIQIMNIMDNWIMEIYMDMVVVYIMMVLLLRENGKTIKWMDLLLINSKIRIYIMDFVNFHLSMEWEYWIWNQKRKYMLVIFGWINIMDLANWSRLRLNRVNQQESFKMDSFNMENYSKCIKNIMIKKKS